MSDLRDAYATRPLEPAPRLSVMEPRGPVSAVVADQLILFREGIVSLCEGWNLSVAAQCGDGQEALEAIQASKPDLAILALDLPKLDTLEILRRVRQSGFATKLLVISTRDDRKTVLEALRGGAHAYLLKSAPARHLYEAIHQTLDGGVYVTPSLEPDRLFGPRRDRPEGDPLESLSAREYQVFHLLVEGFRAKEIAARRGLSAKTVDTYRSALMRKLDIHDLPGLVKFAVQRNLTALK
ncbi:MAG: response regulator transcription factor [Acidobacteria bacterium]|nr:response regulator transcription factor [Acidobacteriota bacterium]